MNDNQTFAGREVLHLHSLPWQHAHVPTLLTGRLVIVRPKTSQDTCFVAMRLCHQLPSVYDADLGCMCSSICQDLMQMSRRLPS